MARLVKRQEELQHDVFRHPPHNYEEFSRMLGQWEENQLQQEALREAVRAFHEGN
jgi:hypothetical protein